MMTSYSETTTVILFRRFLPSEQQTTLWHKEDLAVNKEAVEKIKTAFNACTKAIDFAAPDAKQIIDEDVCKATHGLIEHLDPQIDA